MAFDDDARGERRAAPVATVLARLRIVNEEAYLVRVKGVCGFLEASARPRARGRGVLSPSPVGGAGNTGESFVNGEHCG